MRNAPVIIDIKLNFRMPGVSYNSLGTIVAHRQSVLGSQWNLEECRLLEELRRSLSCALLRGDVLVSGIEQKLCISYDIQLIVL